MNLVGPDFPRTPKVLVVDDNPLNREVLEIHFTQLGAEVQTAADGFQALETATRNAPDLILLDIQMPRMDGYEACRYLKTHPATQFVPIVMVTALDSDEDKIRAIQAGADDFITKPVRPKVFVSKVKALLKRTGAERPEGQVLEANGVRVNLEKVTVEAGGHEMHLPKKEFELLVLLMSKPGKVFKRDEIYDQVWGNELFVGDRTIDVHIRKLREKVGDDRIRTVKGIGYTFEA